MWIEWIKAVGNKKDKQNLMWFIRWSYFMQVSLNRTEHTVSIGCLIHQFTLGRFIWELFSHGKKCNLNEDEFSSES